jgi:hypothetical protein
MGRIEDFDQFAMAVIDGGERCGFYTEEGGYKVLGVTANLYIG